VSADSDNESSRLPFVNFHQLRSFHVVAQEMSFTKAAGVLRIGQPTLTVQVRALEEKYGIELFVRTPKGLRLSRSGQALFEITTQVFFLGDQAVALLRAAGDRVAGRLRVGTVGPFFVMKLLRQFQDLHPLVQVTLESDNSDEVVRKILDSITDVAITGNLTDDPRLLSSHLGSHEIVVFVNRSHPWADSGTIELGQLDGQRMIMREPGSMTRRAFENALGAHDVKPNVVMEVSRDAVREAVIEGLGIGIVSEAEFRAHEELRVLRIADHPSHTHSHVVCLRSRRYAKPIATFVDLAESSARQAGVSDGIEGLGFAATRNAGEPGTKARR
jgi:aminoethylphosphonate catabolism LysR family transcriptional regulator